MKKNFKSIKTVMIMGLLLSSLFVAITPRTSAGILTNLESIVTVDYDAQSLSNIPIQPRGTGFTADLNLTYFVTYSGGIFNFLGSMLYQIHKGRTLVINIEAAGPPWASVTISESPIVTVDETPRTYPIKLTVKIGSDAPAFGAGDIKLKLVVPKVGLIKGYTKEVGISFSAGYIPLVQPNFPEGKSTLIGPMDTADIPIEIQNMGNARTRVYLELVDVPKDWSASITNEVLIEEGEGSKATSYLTVKPPKSFGFHYDTATIYIKYTPEMAENPQYKGDSKVIDVLIESRGFSIIGIEIVLIPLIIIIVILLLIYYFVIKKRSEK
ncbi:MAG: hypothetical protein ACQXXF_02610 [Thermoplasmatota archaeon]|jgi:hypothetical protein